MARLTSIFIILGTLTITLENAPRACAANFIAPAASEEQVFYAATLGADQAVGNDFGRIFAEQMRITCH